MSTTYEMTGRRRQKARTRGALVDAARDFLAEGVAPTVEQAAARAGISRTTAYRYFPNQRALLGGAYPEIAAESLLGPDAPDDPAARFEIVAAAVARQLRDYEPALRAQLRLSLDPGPHPGDELPLRQGRVIGWFEDALLPLRDRMPAAEVRRLAVRLRAAFGIEALVWLTDVAGVERDEAIDLLMSSARTLLHAELATGSG